MELISNNLNSYHPEIRQAVKARDADVIGKMATAAVRAGADYLEVGVPEGPNEFDELNWLVGTAQSACDLPLVICWDGCPDLDKILKTVRKPGILNGICTQETADIILPLFRELPDGWRLILNACAKENDQDIGERVEEYTPMIHQAEENGLMPGRLIIDPCAGELSTNPRAYLDMEDAVDAFMNVYPEVEFVCEPFMIAAGLKKPEAVREAFVTMAVSIGVSLVKADVFDAGIIKAYYASQALLDLGEGLKGYQDSL